MKATAPARVILIAGLIAGTLDITAAFVLAWGEVAPARILKGIATGLLGRAALQGGAGTATLGLGIHFFIALSAAAVFYFASRRLPFMTRRPIAAGVLYGIAVYCFMYFIVIPLSRTHTRYMPSLIAIEVLVHIFCIGLPISLTVYRLSPHRQEAQASEANAASSSLAGHPWR